MKLFKSLLLSLSILTFAQVPCVQAMEFGFETLPYVAQDMYEQIPEYVIPGIAITGLVASMASALYIGYHMEKAAKAAAKGAGNFFEVALLPLTAVECAARKAETFLTRKDVIKAVEILAHSTKK